MHNPEKTILKVDKLTKTFSLPSHEITVLKEVSFTIDPGQPHPSLGHRGVENRRCSPYVQDWIDQVLGIYNWTILTLVP